MLFRRRKPPPVAASDENKRRALIEKIVAQDLTVVSLEDFFEGNNAYGSIGCNLPAAEHPGLQGFYTRLREIRERPDVQNVLVEITEVLEIAGGDWPFSDRVYVLSRASLAEVTEWFADLYTDEVTEGYPFDAPPPALTALAPGMKLYAAWWD